MIGSPLHTGLVSEVVPVAPRPDVRAPLVMERLQQAMRSDDLREHAAAIGELARRLEAPWQRLVSSEFGKFDAQYIYTRFVGLELRGLTAALRTGGRVLPVAILRGITDVILAALSQLEGLPALQGESGAPSPQPLLLSDRSIGLGIDRQWHFAIGALNHWLVDSRRPDTGDDLPAPLSPDALFFLSPEALQGRPETLRSVTSRAALFLYQLFTGHHPFRGNRYDFSDSLMRFSRDEPRVPLSVHPELTNGLIGVLLKGVRFAGDRFESIAEFKAALDAEWPSPAAGDDAIFATLATVCWPQLQQQLHALRREPLLPIKWDGVWTASRTPEEGLAVLEDQFLEQLITVSALPRRGPLPLEPNAPSAPPTAARPVTVNLGPEPRRGFFSRLLSSFLGR